MKKNVYLALFSAALFMGFNVYGQTFDMVIKIDGIPGESKKVGHTGEIDIYSYSDGITGCTRTTTGTAGGAATTTCRPAASTFNYLAQLDKSTIPLYIATAKAQIIPFADVTAIRSGTSPVEFYKIHMESVVVVSAQESGSSGGDSRPTISISLSYAKIAWQYTIPSATGGQDEKVTGGWDFAANKPFSFTFQ